MRLHALIDQDKCFSPSAKDFRLDSAEPAFAAGAAGKAKSKPRNAKSHHVDGVAVHVMSHLVMSSMQLSSNY